MPGGIDDTFSKPPAYAHSPRESRLDAIHFTFNVARDPGGRAANVL
jgi:hypothetical protein